MPEIQKLVAVRQIEKSSSDTVEAKFSAAGKKVRANVGRGIFGGLITGVVRHSLEGC